MSTYVKKEDGTLIESDTEVVKVESNSLKKLWDTTRCCNYIAYYSNARIDFTKIIAYNDTENVINMDNMFTPQEASGYILSGLPLFNTSKVTSMKNMFYYVIFEINSIPKYDTSNVTDISGMFSNIYISSEFKIQIPTFDTSKVTNMNWLFSKTGYIGTRLLLPEPFFDTSNVTNMSNMFNGENSRIGYGSIQSKNNLSEVPLFNTSKVTNIFSMFRSCGNLKIIPAYDFSNVTSASYIIRNTNTLEQFLPTGLKVSFDLSDSTKFTREALVVVLNNLGTPTSTQTLTLGSTNLAKLTEEDIAIATEKNWTLK